MSNSSAIRYAQLIDIDPSIEVYCNRGTSGIDGSTSIAIGVANKNRQSLLMEILVFFMTAMPCGIIISQNFKIILINNGGGGIFRIYRT
jgi:2-succinyl-5-enolpyruvyl-6-hydroxy-3-cyclohexene-1-carboxylate synthase